MMAYTLLVTDEAEDDMQDAADWYRLADSGLEAEFIRTVEACLESIKRNPSQYPMFTKTFIVHCYANFLTAFFISFLTPR